MDDAHKFIHSILPKIVAIFLFFCCIFLLSFDKPRVTTIKERIYVPVKKTTDYDSIAVAVIYRHRWRLAEDSLLSYKDSTAYLKHKNDSLKKLLLVYKIKVERIKQYNKIAGYRNNIKYLRGWITRVTQENN